MKSCCVCKQIKSISEFPKNHTKKDGYQTQCKSCYSEYQKKYRQTKKGAEANRKAQVRYRQTEKGKVKECLYHIQHPEYHKAKDAVHAAVRAGKLPRPDTLLCHYCPKPAQQYHHWHGYEPEHWLDVVPVCRKCHIKMRKML